MFVYCSGYMWCCVCCTYMASHIVCRICCNDCYAPTKPISCLQFYQHGHFSNTRFLGLCISSSYNVYWSCKYLDILNLILICNILFFFFLQALGPKFNCTQPWYDACHTRATLTMTANSYVKWQIPRCGRFVVSTCFAWCCIIINLGWPSKTDYQIIWPWCRGDGFGLIWPWAEPHGNSTGSECYPYTDHWPMSYSSTIIFYKMF